MDKPVVKVLVGGSSPNSSSAVFNELKSYNFNPFRYLPLAFQVVRSNLGTHISLCLILSVLSLLRLPFALSLPSSRGGGGLGGGVFFYLLVSALVYVLFILSVAWVTERCVLNRSVSTAGVLRHSIEKLPMAIVVFAIEMLGVIILLLPFAILPSSLLLLKIAVIPGLIYMGHHLLLVGPAVSLRDHGLGAIGYSSSILKRRFGKIFIHSFCLGLTMALVEFVIGLVASGIFGVELVIFFNTNSLPWMSPSLVQGIIAPIYQYVVAVATTLIFLHLDYEK